MPNCRIVFRADGNSQIGLGHIYRCIAMMEMLPIEFKCLFITNNPEDKIADLIRSYCMLHVINVTNKEEEIVVLSEILTNNDVVVTDGYNFGSEYQKQIKQRVKKLVMIDDLAQSFFFADLVINHGGTPIKNLYKKEKNTKLKVGFDFLILRNAFLEAARSPRTITKIDTVFICMGGSDPFRVTTKVFKACLETEFINKIIIVTGSGYQDQQGLINIIENNRNKVIIHKNNIDATMMIQLIYDSEIAICPSSTVALEVCCVRAGLLTGTLINNQDAIHKQLLDSGCCTSIGNFRNASITILKSALQQFKNYDYIHSMINNQSEKIDGNSGERIVELFKQLVD